MDIPDLAQLIAARRLGAARPVVVGISGYCGSGKSTLARHLAALLANADRLRGDDFLDPTRTHTRSSDWDGVERTRLAEEVLFPLREGRTGMFRRYDWSRHELGEPEPIPHAEILLVDVIGLFHPEALPAIDLTIWCDVDLDTTARRGMARDTARGRHVDTLWRDVWIPNERDFERRYAPRTNAEVRVPTARAGHAQSSRSA